VVGNRCAKVCGFDLWNEASKYRAIVRNHIAEKKYIDWEYLYGLHSTRISCLPGLMKGKLPGSMYDATRLRGEIRVPNFTYTRLMREIHDIRIPPYDAWDKQDALCEQCITGILQTHLHLWLLETRKKGNSFLCNWVTPIDEHSLAGDQIPEDCW
jgi:hypothetical protein